MYSQYYVFKTKVIALRRAGKTYGDIKKMLGKPIAKSTLSHWLRNVILTKIQQERLARNVAVKINRAQVKAWAVSKEIRKGYLKSLSVRNQYLLPLMRQRDIAKIALAMLYLGEGAKWKGHAGLQLGSSDPEIIRIYTGLLKKCYNIPTTKLRARVVYRADQNLSELTVFWSRVTRIPREHFYKTKPDSRTVGKPTRKKGYRGVCQISCAGTEIQLQLDIIAKMFLRVFGAHSLEEKR